MENTVELNDVLKMDYTETETKNNECFFNWCEENDDDYMDNDFDVETCSVSSIFSTESLVNSTPEPDYDNKATENSREDEVFKCNQTIKKLRNMLKRKTDQIRNMKKRLTRRESKLSTLTNVVNALKRKNLITGDMGDHLKGISELIPESIISRFMRNKEKENLSHKEYPPELRMFSITLHFYSPKAYNYVREVFKCALPHSKTIKNWYTSINGEPGFIREAFEALKAKAEIMKKSNQQCLMSLLADEICIMKRVELCGNKYRGLVDMGFNMQADDAPECTEALVFMVNSLNSNFKIPIAYFLIKSLSADERKNLIEDAITRLYECGVRVVCLTTDGPSYNKSMMKKLGAELNYLEPKPFFPHPSNPSLRIYTMLDACHMLKLVRNILGSEKELYTSDGVVKWIYIQKLHDIQLQEGFKLGNKLSKSHIDFAKQKMKVKLAAQTLSTRLV